MEDLNPLQWAILPLKKYATFSGRASRAEYWWFYLATMIVQIPLTVLEKGEGLSWPSTVYTLALAVPTLAVMMRRFHDIDRSGWWLLLLMLVFVGAAVMGVGGAAGITSAFAFTAIVAGIIVLLFAAVTVLVFTVTPGTQGANRFGPDPHGAADDLEEVFA